MAEKSLIMSGNNAYKKGQSSEACVHEEISNEVAENDSNQKVNSVGLSGHREVKAQVLLQNPGGCLVEGTYSTQR